MNALRILIIIVLALGLLRLIRFGAKKTISLTTFLFWAAILVGSVIFFVNPDVSEDIAGLLGIGRGVDSVFFLSILLLLYLNFQLYMRIQKFDRTLTSLTQNVSREIHLLKNPLAPERDDTDRNL